MMYLFSIGIVGVFGVLACMEVRAYSLRKQLELDAVEEFLTRSSIRAHAMTAGIGCLSMLILFSSGVPAWAGLTYFLMWPSHMTHGIRSAIRAEKIHEQLVAATEAGSSSKARFVLDIREIPTVPQRVE